MRKVLIAVIAGAALTVGVVAQEAGSAGTLGEQPAGKLGIGRKVTEDDVARENYTVLPDGKGLPEGRGTAAEGRGIYADQCASCHGENGEGKEGQYPRLVGGVGSLASDQPVKTVGSYWPYATTLFDFIRRAMPYDNPRTLSNDEVYALSAFILSLDGIIAEDEEMNGQTLSRVEMPNRHGFVADPRPDVGPQAEQSQEEQ